MSAMITLVEILLFTGSLFILIKAMKTWQTQRKSGRKHPPAIPSLPIIGSLPFIRDFDALPIFFQKKAKELGPIFTLRFGNKRFLVLNNRESIEDALVRHGSSFSGRESLYAEKYVCNRKVKGIASTNYNANFRRYHKLTLSVLNDFGFGSRRVMESMNLIEITQLVDQFKKTNGKPFDPAHMIMICVSSMSNNIMFGRRHNYEADRNEICLLVKTWLHSIDPVVDIFPFLRFFPPYNRKLVNVANSNSKLLNALEKEAQMSLKDGNVDCFVRRYIEREGDGYDHEQLMFTLRDLAAGSTETITDMILWTFVFLANYPNVAERVQMEIDSVVPRDRLPTMDDQRNLPYTQATVLEIFRHRSVAPMAGPHLTLHDTEVLGFFIPANTIVIPNLRAAHMNKKDWEEPDAFKPERFLNEKNEVINKSRIVTFSLGRRSCPGEQLARLQLFLFITGFLQNFHIRPPEGVDRIDDKSNFGVTEFPSPYELRMITRK